MKKIDLNNKTYERRGTDSVKWDHMDFLDNRATKNTLPLWLSDMEFKVADEILEALKNRIDHSFLGHSMAGDEYFEYLNMVSIEWFKISCEIKEIKYRGRLIEDKVIIYDKRAEIYEILEKFNIPYEYDEIENAFFIYGYKS